MLYLLLPCLIGSGLLLSYFIATLFFSGKEVAESTNENGDDDVEHAREFPQCNWEDCSSKNTSPISSDMWLCPRHLDEYLGR